MFTLIQENGHLAIQNLAQPRQKPVFIDFLNGKLAFRKSKFKNELIAKAIGIKQKPLLKIIDATAGFGIDAFILASLGCDVLMLERVPLIATLLQDALKRLKEKNNSIKLEAVETDAIFFLENLTDAEKPDVIYLDPMYPINTKAAQTKKGMSWLRELTGNDQDSNQLFYIARKTAKKRVVVKRPRLAKPLVDLKPDFCITGRHQRFDVYLSL